MKCPGGEAVTLVVALALSLAGGSPQAAGDGKPVDRLKPLRSVVERLRVEAPGGEADRRVEEPVFLFDDPARYFADGAIWAWERSGRPVALFTICAFRGRVQPGSVEWLCEWTSVATEPLSATTPTLGEWQPALGIVPKPFPKAPEPAPDAAGRLRQMKELSQRFKAHEFFAPGANPTPERYELRVLPRPAYRYSDPDSGVVDGALFIIAYGRNPELFLTVEARGKSLTEAVWTYGLNRISAADLHVKLDDSEVWTHAPDFGGSREPYWTFIIPVDEHAAQALKQTVTKP
jgi:hypothetical protein